MKKGKEKKEENYIKKGGRGLKNASFTYLLGEKMNLKRGGGEIDQMHSIYP